MKLNLGPPIPGLGELPFKGRHYYLIEEMDLLSKDVDKYLGIAIPYVPAFEKVAKFSLVAGGIRPQGRGRHRITHLWRMPSADRLRVVMEFLANDEEYGKIDGLVGRTAYECQDIAVNFGKAHGNLDAPETPPNRAFRYVLVHHQLWTTQLNTYGWVFDFDAGFLMFQMNNPGWLHVGNRMKITGCIYDVFELWIAPVERRDPERVLDEAKWKTPGMKVDVFSPLPYDHNVTTQRKRHAKKTKT